MWKELGNRCHWCGDECSGKATPKTGVHRFCCNEHRKAHGVAFRAYEKNRVPLTSGTRSGPGELSSVKRHAKKTFQGRSHAGEISSSRKVKRHAKKAKKRGMIRGKK